MIPQPLEIATLNPAPLIVPILPAGTLILPDRRPRRRGAGRRACAIERRPVPGTCVIAGPLHDLGRGQRQEAEARTLVARDHRPQDRGCVFGLAPQPEAGARIVIAVKVWCWQTQPPAMPRSGSGRGIPRRTSFASSADMIDRGTMWLTRPAGDMTSSGFGAGGCAFSFQYLARSHSMIAFRSALRPRQAFQSRDVSAA